jgi:hypothetical protein
MRKKLSLKHGTLGLALAASVFLGCQDFLGGDNGKPAAAPTDDNLEHAAQAVAAQDSAKNPPAPTGTPGTAQDTPAPAPANGTLEECKYLWSEMQSKSEDVNYYMDVKYKFIGKNCAQVIGDATPTPPPPPPVDSATQCKNLKGMLDPASPKYASYLAEWSAKCAEAVLPQPVAIEPAATDPEPAKPTPPPTSSSLTPEQQVCADLFKELQTAKEPRYGEVKNQYGEQNCDVVLGDKKPFAPYVPLTLEEKCKMYRINAKEPPRPEDAKWTEYMAAQAIECAAYP